MHSYNSGFSDSFSCSSLM